MHISFKNLFDTEYIYSMREWRNQDFVKKNMVNQDLISEEDHIKYLQMLKDNSDTRKVYVAFADEVPFAIVNFTVFPEERYVEPGMYIIDRNYLGKGLGQVLSYARLEYMFRIMPDGEVRTTILKTNETNLALQRKFGFMDHHTTLVKDGNGFEREALVLFLTKDMWDNTKKEVMKKINGKFDSIIIDDIPVS